MFRIGDHHSNVSTFCSASLITESFYIQLFDLYLKTGCKVIWWSSFDQYGNLRAQWLFSLHRCLLSIYYVSSTERLVRLLVQYGCGSETFEWSNVPYHGAESKRAAAHLPVMQASAYWIRAISRVMCQLIQLSGKEVAGGHTHAHA